MNNKTLGTLALIGAPAMAADTLAEATYPSLFDSWFTGMWGLVYITAWMCSIIAMKRSGALGNSRLGKAMPYVLMTTLSLANVANLIWLFAAKAKPSFFMAIDLFWPISHILMLVVGVLAIRAKKLTGWRRYVPLIMGLWLPFALGSLALIGRTQTGFFIGGLYNAIVVVLLALAVRSLPEPDAGNRTKQQFRPVLQ